MEQTTIRINGRDYTAVCAGGRTDPAWGGRRMRTIRMTESYESMLALFPAGALVEWATVASRETLTPRLDADGRQVTDENGLPVYDSATVEFVTTMHDWPVVGAITDNRDGSYTVKMGTRLSSEVQQELAATEAVLKIVMEGE